ncbi:OLC1v1013153C1 [Oldenlandia corymbosa var. corymbosa]|uniref:OLC1v1013153C1 n=1 Tax=Oldenlandia corymbosa var. corymbosa TaxID=529605 RepID=A0AAV1E182_OLDCO|nr:OLC1v1013153C1 [Oldenlandia corymbosa var. corymbosa]
MGRKHEQIFTFEQIPSYCLKCSKIRHKETDCRVRKPSVLKNEAEKSVVPALKKKGIEIKSATQKWLLKGGETKNDLEAQILSLNPLVVRGVEKESEAAQTVEAHPAEETLDPRLDDARLACGTLAAQSLVVHPANQPLESHQLESTSGLSTMEKETIPLDLQPSPDDGDIDDEVENVFTEVDNHDQRKQDNEVGAYVIVGEMVSDKTSSLIELKMQNMALVLKIGLVRFPDD